MQLIKLGLEIRRIGGMDNLYKDVDRVLSNTNNIEFQAVTHALQKMISNDNHFSVCTIDNCMKIAKIVVPVERYNIYRAAHCMNYNEMLPEFRISLIAMVLDDFRTILNPIK